MPTGYETGAYRDLNRIAKALEGIQRALETLATPPPPANEQTAAAPVQPPLSAVGRETR